MDDPERHGSGRPRTLSIGRDNFEHAYHDPVHTLIESRGFGAELLADNRRFRAARIQERDCWIGEVDQTVAPMGGEGPDIPFASEYLGKDGFLVRLGSSWSETNMRLQPHQRL